MGPGTSPYSSLRLKSDHIHMSGQINAPRTSQNGVDEIVGRQTSQNYV